MPDKKLEAPASGRFRQTRTMLRGQNRVKRSLSPRAFRTAKQLG